MTRCERTIAAINHQNTDIVPYNMYFTSQQHEKMAEYFSDPHFIDKIGNHSEGSYYSGYKSEISLGSGYWKDDFGVVWNRNGTDKDIGVIDGIVLKNPSMEGYEFPELDEKRFRNELQELIDKADDKFKIAGIGYSLFERAWSLRGMENILMDMILEPKFVDQLFDAITEFNIKIIDIALEYDINCFHFGDDWGQQKGMIMGPINWRKFIKPRMKIMYEKIKSRGIIVSQHSCGDIREVLPDLIDIGLDIFRTFQPEIYDLKNIKAEYGNDITFWGGISTQSLLPFESPVTIKKVVLETIDIMSKSGGYVLAPTHAIAGDVPIENIVALIDVFQNQK